MVLGAAASAAVAALAPGSAGADGTASTTPTVTLPNPTPVKLPNPKPVKLPNPKPVKLPNPGPIKLPAAPPSVSVNDDCFVDHNAHSPTRIVVTGTGWAAGSTVTLHYGSSAAVQAKAGRWGTIHRVIHGPAVGQQPRVRTFVLTARNHHGQRAKTSPFRVTSPRVWFGFPGKTVPDARTLTYYFLGFGEDKVIYEHFFFHNKLVATRNFGLRVVSPCTVSAAHATPFPVKQGVKGGEYVDQFDNVRRFSARAWPRVAGPFHNTGRGKGLWPK